MKSTFSYNLLVCLFTSTMAAMQHNNSFQQGLRVSIVSYDPENHKDGLRRLARENIKDLVCWYAYKWDKSHELEQAVETQVMEPNEESPQDTKVVLVSDTLVGYIRYTSKMPWYRQLVGSEEGANVYLAHIAVDQRFRHQNIGSLLMDRMLNDCSTKKVNKVYLWTAGFDLQPFFEKHGFTWTAKTKMWEVRFERRLRQHPMLELARFITSKLKK